VKTLHLETTAPFQGLPELVADAEGLFAKEGLKIVWEDVDAGVDRTAQTHIVSPQTLILSRGMKPSSMCKAR